MSHDARYYVHFAKVFQRSALRLRRNGHDATEAFERVADYLMLARHHRPLQTELFA